ncbi:MAG: hypothetical protein A3I05_03650 [Deltaproteobacteria bacterium RIFCSPLOWO2_02_FULL_44_10]|nr:MAG: hypothetical protein A3C46_03220 [Deltaproteobacteria bacterium RIFCSPHIGHO2_02_FULL_44_16]OGQ46260.1 MAG: hypothetical protein A3I05_03650 [Deltaproteobacteria bacterium RIFCSPLOWO2_02_FULL_44_10]
MKSAGEQRVYLPVNQVWSNLKTRTDLTITKEERSWGKPPKTIFQFTVGPDGLPGNDSFRLQRVEYESAIYEAPSIRDAHAERISYFFTVTKAGQTSSCTLRMLRSDLHSGGKRDWYFDDTFLIGDNELDCGDASFEISGNEVMEQIQKTLLPESAWIRVNTTTPAWKETWAHKTQYWGRAD